MLAGHLNVLEVPGAIIIKIRVQPRASRNAVGEIVNGVLKIRLTAPPVDGEANQLCIRFLAELLDVPRSKVSIIQGNQSREKKVKIEGLSVDKLMSQLQ